MGSEITQMDRWSQAVRGRARRLVASSQPLSLAYLGIARYLTAIGISPPLSGKAEEQERRWRNQGLPGSNDSPDTYLVIGDTGRCVFSEVMDVLPDDVRILEIGCNAGRNLDYLYQQGYRDLWGIEIGPRAVQRFGDVFPETRRSTHLVCGNAVEELKRLPENHFDLVFTRGVLVNVHPKHNSLFADMCRISRSHILTAENEGAWTSWPRDFGQTFGSHGFSQISARQEPLDGLVTEADGRIRTPKFPTTIRLFSTRDSLNGRSSSSTENESIYERRR